MSVDLMMWCKGVGIAKQCFAGSPESIRDCSSTGKYIFFIDDTR